MELMKTSLTSAALNLDFFLLRYSFSVVIDFFFFVFTLVSWLSSLPLTALKVKLYSVLR